MTKGFEQKHKQLQEKHKQLQENYNTLGNMFSRCQTQLDSLFKYQENESDGSRGGSNRFKTKKQNKRRRKTRRRRN